MHSHRFRYFKTESKQCMKECKENLKGGIYYQTLLKEVVCHTHTHTHTHTYIHMCVCVCVRMSRPSPTAGIS